MFLRVNVTLSERQMGNYLVAVNDELDMMWKVVVMA
jgi:hypothetical protein